MKILKNILVGCALAAAASTALAVPITDVVNPNPDVLVTTTVPYSYTHNLTDEGYDPLLSTITSALLTVRLTDSGGSETFKFLISTGLTEQIFSDNNVPSSRSYPIDIVASLQDLIADGLLNIKITSQAGSFSFADSSLTADVVAKNVTTNVATVPEPGTLALLGLSLLGLVATRRRKA